MPNIKSAKKRVATNNRKKEENQKVKSTMKTAIKNVEQSNEDSALKKAFRAIDKALKKNIIKKNHAARKKSQLAKKTTKQS